MLNLQRPTKNSLMRRFGSPTSTPQNNVTLATTTGM